MGLISDLRKSRKIGIEIVLTLYNLIPTCFPLFLPNVFRTVGERKLRTRKGDDTQGLIFVVETFVVGKLFRMFGMNEIYRTVCNPSVGVSTLMSRVKGLKRETEQW